MFKVNISRLISRKLLHLKKKLCIQLRTEFSTLTAFCSASLCIYSHTNSQRLQICTSKNRYECSAWCFAKVTGNLFSILHKLVIATLYRRQIRPSGMSVSKCEVHGGAAGLLRLLHYVRHALQHEHGEAEDD